MALKANEVRLGNHLNLIVGGSLYKGGIVTSVNEDCIYLNSIKVRLEAMEPIPLTQEWLLKLGFDKHSKYSFSKGDLKIINRHGWWDAIIRTEVLRSVEHVHQLQNLYFALIGE